MIIIVGLCFKFEALERARSFIFVTNYFDIDEILEALPTSIGSKSSNESVAI